METFVKFVEKFAGHNLRHIKNLSDLTRFMYQPVDATSISVGRMLFGFLMLIDIPEERQGSKISERWGDAKTCHFPIISSIQPMNASMMAIVYLFMWLGAIGIFLGFKFKITSALFTICYWYIFLLDTSVWNNHSYLYGLCGILFMFSSAHNYCSVDAFLAGKLTKRVTVPFWNYFILKFQFFIMYFVAGLKKFSLEWLSGYAMNNLSYHWVLSPFRFILGAEITDLVIIHWFTCLFDLTIGFFLIYQPTRKIATMFCVAFHLMNSRLFSIGMFPWVCLAELPLFYSKDWPLILLRKIKKILQKPKNRRHKKNSNNTTKGNTLNRQIGAKEKLVVCFIIFYCLVQVILPYSHFITNGFNNWTHGIYGYSWDMMIHAWDTVLVTIKITENDGCMETHYLNPDIFSKTDRWTKHAYLAHQYVSCIHRNLLEDFHQNSNTILTTSNYSIYLDVWCSLNKRFQQRMFDPNVDIVQAKWSPYERIPWTKPLLDHFTYMRPKIRQINKDVLEWSNFTDVMFLADFPGLTMDTYISSDLDNVTLTVLDGIINVETFDMDNYSLTNISTGESVHIQSGSFHQITTIGRSPSCVMYTYINRTLQHLVDNLDLEYTVVDEPFLPLWTEFKLRLRNYLKFFLELHDLIFKNWLNIWPDLSKYQIVTY